MTVTTGHAAHGTGQRAGHTGGITADVIVGVTEHATTCGSGDASARWLSAMCRVTFHILAAVKVQPSYWHMKGFSPVCVRE